MDSWVRLVTAPRMRCRRCHTGRRLRGYSGLTRRGCSRFGFARARHQH